nr:hypothetical protein [Nocardia yamanashiensis]
MSAEKVCSSLFVGLREPLRCFTEQSRGFAMLLSQSVHGAFPGVVVAVECFVHRGGDAAVSFGEFFEPVLRPFAPSFEFVGDIEVLLPESEQVVAVGFQTVGHADSGSFRLSSDLTIVEPSHKWGMISRAETFCPG